MTSQNEESLKNDAASELDENRWSVVSFSKCEASGLTYSSAVNKLKELETVKVNGLCIVSDETAARLNGRGKA
ncbi:MAG: hypothetical protein ABR535_09945 [Pyrinomonadaceae bacterium]